LGNEFSIFFLEHWVSSDEIVGEALFDSNFRTG
jgi:hypothetical protein